jgi:hypothetical protein
MCPFENSAFENMHTRVMYLTFAKQNQLCTYSYVALSPFGLYMVSTGYYDGPHSLHRHLPRHFQGYVTL